MENKLNNSVLSSREQQEQADNNARIAERRYKQMQKRIAQKNQYRMDGRY